MDFLGEITYVLYSFKPPTPENNAEPGHWQTLADKKHDLDTYFSSTSIICNHDQEPKARRNGDSNEIASFQEDPCPCWHRRY